MVLNTNGPVAPLVPPTYDPLPPMPSFAEIFAANGDEDAVNSGGSPSGSGGGGVSSSAAGQTRIGSTPRSKTRTSSGGRDSMAVSRIGGGSSKRGEQFSMNDRSRADFDRDLVRLVEDGKVRVPGCVQIVSLSLAHNPHVTDRGVSAFEKILRTQEPARTEECSMVGGVPSQYCGTLCLQRLELRNTNVSEAVMNKLQLSLQKVIARRG